MNISVDTINLRFNVKPDYDQQHLQRIRGILERAKADLAAK